MRERVARAWFAATALTVLVGVVVQVLSTAELTAGVAPVLEVFVYFTITSNIVLGVTCAMLALRTDRTSPAFQAMRLSGVLAMAITGIVFHVALAPLYEFLGLAAVANVLCHTVTPLLGAIGWLVFGPRGRTSSRVVAGATVYPVVWLVLTLVRGPLANDFYPYPFLDVGEHGYPRVILNALIVAVVFLALAAGATALDRVLARRTAPAAV